MTNPTAAPRDFAAEFIAARVASRRDGATLAQRGDAQATAAKIERAARRAGVELDAIALDEQARQQVTAARPVAPAPAPRPFWL